jgi:hypothetical protein
LARERHASATAFHGAGPSCRADAAPSAPYVVVAVAAGTVVVAAPALLVPMVPLLLLLVV